VSSSITFGARPVCPWLKSKKPTPVTVAVPRSGVKVADLYDRAALVALLRDADAAIHTASPGDETSANLDAAVADAAIEAFAGTGKPYLHISGVWIYGGNTAITEASPFNAPALVAWKEPIERRIVEAIGMRGVVIVSSVVYGDGGGALPGLLLGSPRERGGNLIMVGSGRQHWSTIHVADLANFFFSCLKTKRHAATTSSATASTRQSRNSPRPPPLQSALPAPSRARTKRSGRVWATTSLKSSCLIRARAPARRGLISAGNRRGPGSSTNSATGATAKSRRKGSRPPEVQLAHDDDAAASGPARDG